MNTIAKPIAQTEKEKITRMLLHGSFFFGLVWIGLWSRVVGGVGGPDRDACPPAGLARP